MMRPIISYVSREKERRKMFTLLKTEFSFFQAQSLAKKKRLDKSIAMYESALSARPSHSGMRVQFGLTLLRNSEQGRALEELERAREADPSNPVIPMFIGIALLVLERDEEALEALEASLALNAANELCLSLKGIALLRLGRISDGAETLDKSFFYGNDYLDFFILRFCESMCADKNIDSAPIFEMSIEDPVDQGAAGFLNSLLTRLDDAIDEIDYRFQILTSKISPFAPREKTKFLREMHSGLTLYTRDRVEEAKAAFGKCAEMDYTPDPVKKNELCGYLYHIEEFERLDALLDKYYGEDAAPPPEIRLLKARTAVRQEKYDEASHLITEYEKDHSPDASSEYLKGVCHIRSGNKKEAGVAFKNVIAESKQNLNKFYLTECLRLAEMNRDDDNPP